MQFGSRVSVGESGNPPPSVSLPRFDGPDFLENALANAARALVYNRHTSRLTPYFRDSGHRRRRRRRHITPVTSLLLQRATNNSGSSKLASLYTLSLSLSPREELE